MDLGWTVRRARGRLYQWLGANRRARARLDGTRGCILTYHRVLPAAIARRDAVEPAMYVTPESFRLQLSILAELFHVMPLAEMTERVLAGRALPPRACAITFDDGWRDNHDHALPELRRAGLPATVFVVTDRIGTEGPFWPDEVCRRLEPLDAPARAEAVRAMGLDAARSSVDDVLGQLKDLDEAARVAPLERLREAAPLARPLERELMTWDELHTLQAADVTIESHGATHAILTGLADADAARELESSRRALVERGLGVHGLFAYPSGRHAPGLHALAARAGYTAAFALDERLVELGGPAMALSRMGMHEGIGRTRVEFLCKVPGGA